MSGFLIYQSAHSGSACISLAPALNWFCQEKRVPIVGSIAQPGISVTKFGRHHSASADIAHLANGWLASIGSWNHPQCSRPNDNGALLDLLTKNGELVLADLDGFYALAWCTERTGALTIATDHIGRLHVFYAITSGGAFVSTSCVALARVVSSDPDMVGVYEMLATGTIYETRTPFRQIHRIPAASMFEFHNGRLVRETRHKKMFTGSAVESGISTGEFVGVLESSLHVSLDCSARPLCDLTGGLDSRLVLGLILRLQRSTAVTVTGWPTDPDVRIAREIARRLGIHMEVDGAEPIQDYQKKFDNILRATTLSEGGHDPISYAAIENIHTAHAGLYDLSVNGSGGELLRNYWWDRSHLQDEKRDIIAEGAQRFVRSALAPPIVRSEFRLDLSRHFQGVVARCLDGVEAAPAHEKLDHLYLYLRMQCWQGSIASATNQIWAAGSPFLSRASLAGVSRLDPRLRLGARVMQQIFAKSSRILSTYPLDTGFPPMALSLSSSWRFLPGLMRMPLVLGRRFQGGSRAALGAGKREAVMVRALFASGAADYLDFPAMTLRFCLDAGAFDRFAKTARHTGEVSLSLLGRLIALESVYRAASGRP